MTESWWKDAEEDPTHQAAAEWFAKLQRSDISGEELLAWQRWLAADPRNADAFARLEDITAMLRDVPRPMSHVSTLRPSSAYDGSQSISGWQRRKASIRSFALAASVAGALIAGAWGAWTLYSNGRSPNIVQTEVGENRTVTLPDGSRVTLGGDTSVSTAFSEKARDIQLTRGEALFVVAKDKTRPFRVQAGKTTVTAIGTQFNVRRREARVDVAVVEGVVLVEPSKVIDIAEPVVRSEPSGDATPRLARRAEVRVVAGEKAVVGNAGVQSTSQITDTDAPIAWQSGRLVFNREPLRGVIEDVNRYSRKPLSFTDESIGDLMFTGTVVNGNVDAWIASIEEVFSLDAIDEPDRVVLRYRAP